MKRNTSFSRYLLQRLLTGDDGSRFASELRDAFLREFADQPEAEKMRIRYRLWVSGLCFAALLLAGAVTYLGPSSVRDPFLNWMSVAAISISILPSCDYAVVRAVMRRRQKVVKAKHPRLAEALLSFFLSPSACDDTINDLNVAFVQRRNSKGLRYARAWYWFHTFRSLNIKLDGIVQMLLKLGFVSTLMDWLRRHL